MRLRTFTTARLDDEDILSANALFDLDPRLADLELAKQDLCRRDAEVVADGPGAAVSRSTMERSRATQAYSVSWGWELPPRTTMFRTMTPVVGVGVQTKLLKRVQRDAGRDGDERGIVWCARGQTREEA